LGREAALKAAIQFSKAHRKSSVCDCFAAERGQAPSPQGIGGETTAQPNPVPKTLKGWNNARHFVER
jgi:hypothetical protein